LEFPQNSSGFCTMGDVRPVNRSALEGGLS
jgi:hypothetical protein